MRVQALNNVNEVHWSFKCNPSSGAWMRSFKVVHCPISLGVHCAIVVNSAHMYEHVYWQHYVSHITVVCCSSPYLDVRCARVHFYTLVARFINFLFVVLFVDVLMICEPVSALAA